MVLQASFTSYKFAGKVCLFVFRWKSWHSGGQWNDTWRLGTTKCNCDAIFVWNSWRFPGATFISRSDKWV